MVLELPHLVGVVLSLIAAALFAVQFLCIRLGTVRGGIIQGVFVTLLVNVVIVVPITLVVYGIPSLTMEAILWFASAGIIGSLIARTCVFKSVQIIGASRTSPVLAANVFFATILAVILFDESLTMSHALGIIVIVVGVAIISWETANDANADESFRDVGISLLLPLFAAIFISLEPILVALGLSAGVDVLPGVAIKVTAAWTGVVAYLLVSGGLTWQLVSRSKETAWYLAAGVTGAVGIVAYFAALDVSPVVIVVPLIQISPLLVLLLSWIFMPQRLERLNWKLFAAAIVVVIGASVVGVQ